MNRETIAAISTPPGDGGIGVIRISGAEAKAVLESVWKEKSTNFQSRKIYVGTIGFDQVIAFYMKAPYSYTGEDVVEIQAHGGRRGLEILLDLVLKSGARLANPGEFTQRAFLNGRMDLAQAEAVADLIAATSEEAVKLATRQREGSLSEYVKKLRNDLKVMRAQMEAMIDFPEDEDVQGLRYDEVIERVERVQTQIETLLQTYEEGRYLKEGIRVAIVGKPNVGKSSLFNALLKQDRSIIHDTPGTTRDTIEEVLHLNGLVIRFIDTAGIRAGNETIEAEGIRRSYQKIEEADLILCVLDSSRPLEKEDEELLNQISERRALLILNKIDLPPAFDPPWRDQKRMIHLSAKTGEGIDHLKTSMVAIFKKTNRSEGSEIILTTLRHRNALKKGNLSLDDVKVAANNKSSLELLVSDLTLAMNALGEITGEVTNDEILGEIFSKFCIGK